MTIQDAITKAIAGGWTHEDWKMRADATYRVADGVVQAQGYDGYEWNDLFEIASALLDPAFWQALGKTEGWQPGTAKRYQAAFCQHDMFGEIEMQSVVPLIREPLAPGQEPPDEAEGICEVCGWKIHGSIPEWQYIWHRLIDHLADGGTIATYFEQL